MPFDDWNERIRSCWWEIVEAQPPDNLPDRADFQLFPYLHCSSDYYREYWVYNRRLIEITTKAPGTSWNPKITVWNSGSFPSWTCHVEVLENPGAILKARTTLSLQPEETAEVTLELTMGAEGTSLQGVCYDPVFDPLELSDPLGRKSTPLALVMAQRAPGLRVPPWHAAVRGRRHP